METTKKIGYRDILRQKEYMKTIIAALINRFGDSVDSIAFTWLVYMLTGSAAWSAVIFGVNRVPTVFLQPFAGAMVEGKNKKSIMIITDLIRGACVAYIATALVTGFLNKWMLLVTSLIISSAEAFRGPASMAIIPKILEKKYFDFGLSLSSSLSSIMEIIGIGLAGVIISVLGVAGAIYIDMATFILSAVIIMTLHIKEDKQKREKIEVLEYLKTLKAGFQYVWENKIIKFFIILCVFLNGILVPFNSLQAPLIEEILHSPEAMLSVLGVSMTIGMLLGSVFYPYVKEKLSNRWITAIGGLGVGIFYLGLVAFGSFQLSRIVLYILVALLSVLSGIIISLLIAFLNIEIMKRVEENYMARVGALFNALSVAATPVVSFIIGIVAKYFNTTQIFIVAGILDFIVCIIMCSRKELNKEKEVLEEVEEA